MRFNIFNGDDDNIEKDYNLIKKIPEFLNSELIKAPSSWRDFAA